MLFFFLASSLVLSSFSVCNIEKLGGPGDEATWLYYYVYFCIVHDVSIGTILE